MRKDANIRRMSRWAARYLQPAGCRLSFRTALLGMLPFKISRFAVFVARLYRAAPSSKPPIRRGRGTTRQSTRASCVPAPASPRGCHCWLAPSPGPLHRPPMPANITAQYAALVAAGEIERDRAQEMVVGLLALDQRLAHHRPPQIVLARWLFGAASAGRADQRALYFGDVGRGKTMLMDLSLPRARWCASGACISMNSSDVHERVRACQQPRPDESEDRSGSPPPRSRTKVGCFVSTNFMSPTLPMR